MASTDIRTFLQYWQRSDQTSERLQQKFLLEGMETYRQRKSSLFKRFKKGSNVRNQIVRWMEERSYENYITGTLASTTLTFSGNLLGAALTADNMRQHVKINTILYRPSDRVFMKVTAVNYTGLSCTVAAHGNNSLSNDSAATEYQIIGQTSSDYDTTYVPRSIPRSFRECSTQIWKDYVEIPHSTEQTAMERVASELRHQLKHCIEDLSNKVASSALIMEPPYSGGAYVTAASTQTPAMTGLITWPKIVQAELANTNVYVNNSSVAIDTDALNSLVIAMEDEELCDFDSGDWVIGCHGVTHQYLSDEFVDVREFGMKETEIGYQVQSFRSKRGKVFPVVRDNYLPKDHLVIVNCSDCEWGYFGQQGLRVKELAESYENITVKKVTFQTYGLVVRRPRQIGMIYGLPTSYSG